MTLDELNQLDDKAACDWFETTCAARRWVNAMVAARPYASAEMVYSQAVEVWQSLAEADYREAFEAHPMIGDVNSLRAKFANTKHTAAAEQQGTAVASEETLESLHRLNHEYLNRHGFIFIICATGLSADTMLDALSKRLPNDTATELANAAAEQIKITLLRLTKGLSDPTTQEATS
ncbi:2-oxo-4-hydroxy-4-carboxy-5-ureidoimidazoline decarboxylase [Alteromonas lipolytica]|uniref:2-oxo-4-hydroxy-4-carboxy-5-ureidoimidazoline decarboxylase n=1 Tax=Alteromonas lipolytica TaxID=1856405 RepID=A0A1E8FK98_9ALTE|nr:2-oxo-4-hydroxy-4-carboxy-5-ureidoimidazoline decarboxylase [Alteromonas lipolytica]OFI36371.1 OHCU decarboxylase [Alteromonas lipolytica]GGF70467.1 2-oxo-4-hydroxy-4-carboxy-5-ureidoimidazoline decarboxylase [Alteromonas lipolytica]